MECVLLSILYGVCSMAYVLWSMEYVLWSVLYGVCFIEYVIAVLQWNKFSLTFMTEAFTYLFEKELKLTTFDYV